MIALMVIALGLLVQFGVILSLMQSIRNLSGAHATERARLVNLILAKDPQTFTVLQKASHIQAAAPEPTAMNPFTRQAPADVELTPEGPPPLPLGL